MNMDIVDLRQFYATGLGTLTRGSIGTALKAIWSPISDERLVGFGYVNHFLDLFMSDAERSLSFMPAAQGGVHWPLGKPCSTALVFEEDLPLADSSIDRLLVVHAFEHCENPQGTLQEFWRVLSPGGKLVMVLPNRRGVWARLEHTPFGAGRPYSGGQISKLLRETMFTPTSWGDALHYPPSQNLLVHKAANIWERLGHRFTPAFAGVIIVEATKQIYQGLPVKQRQSRRIFAPVLSPQGSAQGSSRGAVS